MITDLKEAFDVTNLKRAWRWLNSNSDGFYKAYFRNIYEAYGIALDANLADLHKRLRNQEFQPQHATKLYLPKKSGIQRVYTLLTVEDQVLYQAMVNIVAERLRPRTRKQYLTEVFGNLYAGKSSAFFYLNWRKCYAKYGQTIRKAYERGFIHTASFDLTACYDTIDHAVLCHLLEDLGLQKEFSFQLCEYLKHWTAAMAETRIYQGHGIPQGPMASGVLSEVVLKYFDEKRTKKPKEWIYCRYVDDIRLFAKNEHDLRVMLVEMDLLSKKIGLFPQTSKIDIHRITNIEDEIKSISNPPEHIGSKSAPNQNKVVKRLIELTPRLKVKDDTRFKFVLGAASPSAKLSKRLALMLKHNVHLYVCIFRYFSKYREIKKDISTELLRILQENELYPAFTAEGLRTLIGRCHPEVVKDLEVYAKSLIAHASSHNDELVAAAYSILIGGRCLTYREIREVISGSREWWTRSDLLGHVDIAQIGEPSYQVLMSHFINDPSADVSLVAAHLLLQNSLEVSVPPDRINRLAQTTLKESGVINVRRDKECPVSVAMQYMLGQGMEDINWKAVLGKHYLPVRRKAARLRSYSETNATAWVNLLDTVHDNILESLFDHDVSTGGYSGNIGSHLQSKTTRFASKYPKTFRGFKMVHDKRYQSELSHSKVKRTKRSTTIVEFKFIGKVRLILRKAYQEIWDNW